VYKSFGKDISGEKGSFAFIKEIGAPGDGFIMSNGFVL
jgi:hypothetical protein